MIVKRYYAQDMPSAMALIRAELGPDAVILSSKQVRKKGLRGFFQKKELEVVAAYEPRLESPKAKEEREAAALAAAMRAQGVSPAGRLIPPAPSAPLGPMGETHAGGMAAAAYRKSGNQTVDPILAALETARAAQQGHAANAASEAPIAEAAMDAHPAPLEPTPIAALHVPLQQQDRLEMMDRKLSEMAQIVGNVARRFEDTDGSPMVMSEEVKALYELLLDQDVDAELSRELALEVQQLATGDEGADVRDILRNVLLREMQSSAPLHFEKGERRIVMFAGPTGVGKTTTLVKLATMCSVRQELKVGLINADTYRIAAQEQLKIYADILDVPLQVMYDPDELPGMLSSMEDREVIFIDTAGKRPGDEQHREDISKMLRLMDGNAEVLLCVSAPTGPRNLREIIKNYNFLRVFGMILTKTDEAVGLGAAVNACHFSGQGLTYLTSGQSVPDDIEEADAVEMVDRILA